MGGFVCNLGFCNSLEAEIWGALEGLKMAWNMGLDKIILESDSTVLVELLNRRNEAVVKDRNLLISCMNLVKKDWQLIISHVYREGNRSADWMANFSLKHEQGVSLHESPPTEVENILVDDASGVF